MGPLHDLVTSDLASPLSTLEGCASCLFPTPESSAWRSCARPGPVKTASRSRRSRRTWAPTRRTTTRGPRYEFRRRHNRPGKTARHPPSYARPAEGSGCWSRRTRSCAARLPISRGRTSRQAALHGRERAPLPCACLQ